MKAPALILSMIALFSFQVSPNVKAERIISKKLMIDPLIYGVEKKQKKFEPADVMLIAHDRFAFIEYLEEEPNELDLKESLNQTYLPQTNLFSSYRIQDEKLSTKYSYLIGQKVKLNDYEGAEVQAEVVDVVLVVDRFVEFPYIAAVLDTRADSTLYYSWVSTQSLTSHPFRLVHSTTESDLDSPIRAAFENAVPFAQFEERYAQSEELEEMSLTVNEFEHFGGTNYYVVQYNAIGTCGGLLDNITSVYMEKNGGVELIATGNLNYYFLNLIDIDEDGYPELLMGDFAASAIFTLNRGDINLLKELSWSFDGCPC